MLKVMWDTGTCFCLASRFLIRTRRISTEQITGSKPTCIPSRPLTLAFCFSEDAQSPCLAAVVLQAWWQHAWRTWQHEFNRHLIFVHVGPQNPSRTYLQEKPAAAEQPLPVNLASDQRSPNVIMQTVLRFQTVR